MAYCGDHTGQINALWDKMHRWLLVLKQAVPVLSNRCWRVKQDPKRKWNGMERSWSGWTGLENSDVSFIVLVFITLFLLSILGSDPIRPTSGRRIGILRSYLCKWQYVKYWPFPCRSEVSTGLRLACWLCPDQDWGPDLGLVVQIIFGFGTICGLIKVIPFKRLLAHFGLKRALLSSKGNAAYILWLWHGQKFNN
jgi:hypothetical protein